MLVEEGILTDIHRHAWDLASGLASLMILRRLAGSVVGDLKSFRGREDWVSLSFSWLHRAWLAGIGQMGMFYLERASQSPGITVNFSVCSWRARRMRVTVESLLFLRFYLNISFILPALLALGGGASWL